MKIAHDDFMHGTIIRAPTMLLKNQHAAAEKAASKIWDALIEVNIQHIYAILGWHVICSCGVHGNPYNGPDT